VASAEKLEERLLEELEGSAKYTSVHVEIDKINLRKPLLEEKKQSIEKDRADLLVLQHQKIQHLENELHELRQQLQLLEESMEKLKQDEKDEAKDKKRELSDLVKTKTSEIKEKDSEFKGLVKEKDQELSVIAKEILEIEVTVKSLKKDLQRTVKTDANDMIKMLRAVQEGIMAVYENIELHNGFPEFIRSVQDGVDFFESLSTCFRDCK